MRFGAHVSAAGGVAKALDRAAGMGADAAQIFLSSPRSWTFKPPDPLPDLAAAMAGAGIASLVAHASYLINLASPDEGISSKSVALLASTLAAADGFGIEAVVLHAGSHLGAGVEPALSRWAAAIEKALEGLSEVTLLLENTAGGGGTLGRSIEELALLASIAAQFGRVGVCLDTQHLFASGYDLRDPSALADLGREVEHHFGRVNYIHLNDSKTGLGSNHDRHENLGEGEIGAAGLGSFLKLPAVAEAVTLLEVPGDGTGPRAADIVTARGLLG